jgi:hypothetical protein
VVAEWIQATMAQRRKAVSDEKWEEMHTELHDVDDNRASTQRTSRIEQQWDDKYAIAIGSEFYDKETGRMGAVPLQKDKALFYWLRSQPKRKNMPMYHQREKLQKLGTIDEMGRATRTKRCDEKWEEMHAELREYYDANGDSLQNLEFEKKVRKMCFMTAFPFTAFDC